ncbi:hypothetical protein ACFV2N_22600 [Streptomyces sp. NPDC059680]|uniref:hypothetical protein n=1 Tax=Streptomyces sp. NPDC059680 TaxID=3346904 RepID=UPI0036784481
MTRRPTRTVLLRGVSALLLLAYFLFEKTLSLIVSTSRRKAHRLASGEAAQQARHASEARLRTIAGRYEEETPLTLRLLAIDDHCVPGTLNWDLFSPRWPTCKVRCTMRLTAYYTSPLPVSDTIDAILTAGDQPLSPIPFTHEHEGTGTELIPGPPGDMVRAGHILDWDKQGHTLPEPEQNPSGYGTVREPPHTTVSGIRRLHGAVYRLTLPTIHYYRVPR